MVEIIQLITAFGLGSIVTALIQSWLSQNAAKTERSFREKQAAYVGLLEAWREAAAAEQRRKAGAVRFRILAFALRVGWIASRA